MRPWKGNEFGGGPNPSKPLFTCYFPGILSQRLTSGQLWGGLGQGGMDGAEAAPHGTQPLGEPRLLPLQQLLHLPDGSQELLPAEAALWEQGWGQG